RRKLQTAPVETAFSQPSIEIEMLLCCCRTKIELETLNQIQALLSKNINWAKLIEIAQKQRVLPLLY
ncbi:MAG: hypothetical protein ACKPCP_07045, partial [Sphaerospermopsis kisseleviana]